MEAAVGTHSLAELRALPVQKIIQRASFYFPVGADGYVLPAHPAEVFAAGRQMNVPTFIGNTRDEGFSALTRITTVAEYRRRLNTLFGADAGDIQRLYPASTDAAARRVAFKLANAGEFERQMVQWARLQTHTGTAPAYLYVFSAPEGLSPHGRDVAFWFGTLDLLPNASGQQMPVTAADRVLSNEMMDLLVAYARTGVPSTARIHVPRYDLASQRFIVLGDPVRVRAVDTGLDYLLAHPQLIVGIGEPGLNPLESVDACDGTRTRLAAVFTERPLIPRGRVNLRQRTRHQLSVAGGSTR